MLLTVVSYYASRPDCHLRVLLGELSRVSSQILLVMNVDGLVKAQVSESSDSLRILAVPNRGMNIGAWDAAYRMCPDYDHYVFLQDECVLVDPTYQERYISKLSTVGAGMTGESINPKWDASWGDVKSGRLNYPIESNGGATSTDRVTFYLDCFDRWGVEPGPTATHLRALVWGFTNDCLRAIDGFPIGASKEECIAAEIAVSRKVVSRGFSLSQIGSSPFECFRHIEWKLDGSSKIV